VVLLDPAAQPGEHPLAAGALARRDRVARLRLGRRGQCAGVQAGRERELPRRAVDVAARHLLPGTVEGREDGVRTTVLRAHLADVGDEQPRLPAHLHPVERRLDAPVARHRERRDVGREVERARAHLSRQRGQLLLRPALAHDEVGAALAQRRAQLGQAAMEEPGAVAGREAALQEPRIEHEDGHDAVAVPVRRGQARMVVDAQVTAEPDEGGGRHVRGTGEPRSRTYTQSASD
jgi:hypothetical protein